MHALWGLVAAALIVIGVFIFVSGGEEATTFVNKLVIPDSLFKTPDTAVPVVSQKKISLTPGIERWYTNDARTFSFRLPDDFSAPALDTGVPGVEGMMLERPGYEPLVVLVHQVPPLFTLSDQSIRANLPGVTVTTVRDTFLGTVVRALVFRTHSAERGDGIELWAVNNGKLYRLATSPDNEDLLQFVIENWYFAPPFPSTP